MKMNTLTGRRVDRSTRATPYSRHFINTALTLAAAAGYHATSYTIGWNAAAKEYRIALSGLVER